MDLGYIHSIKKNIKKFFKNSTKKKLIMIWYWIRIQVIISVFQAISLCEIRLKAGGDPSFRAFNIKSLENITVKLLKNKK